MAKIFLLKPQTCYRLAWRHVLRTNTCLLLQGTYELYSVKDVPSLWLPLRQQCAGHPLQPGWLRLAEEQTFSTSWWSQRNLAWCFTFASQRGRNALHIWTISCSPNHLLVSGTGPCVIMALITLLNSAPAYSSHRMALTICRYFKVAILASWSLPDLAERHACVWNACFPSPFHHKVANLILHNTIW